METIGQTEEVCGPSLVREHSPLLRLLTPACPRAEMEISFEGVDKDKMPRLIVCLEKLRPPEEHRVSNATFGSYWKWQKRCIVIFKDKMNYYKSGEKYLSGEKELGTVPLKHMWALFVEKSQKDGTRDPRPELTLRTPWRDFHLRVDQHEDSQEVRDFPRWSTPHRPEDLRALARVACSFGSACTPATALSPQTTSRASSASNTGKHE